MTLAVGALLQDNRYQIQAVLTSTDIEIVYQAVHTYLDRTVILKQLRHDDVDWAVSAPPIGRTIMARLLRLAQCQHPCLGEVVDCFEEDGHVYLVLPTYGDLTMAKWLQTHGPMKPFEMLAHLRSLIDIFDKFHENNLIYGHLSPHVLHHRTETNELVVTDVSWRMFIADLLGDRHRLNYSKHLDLKRLAYIAYSLLTGDCSAFCSPQDSVNSSQSAHNHNGQYDVLDGIISVPKLNTIRLIANLSVETVISNALYPQTTQSLTPTDWFIGLQQALCSPLDHEGQDEKISEPSSPMGLQVFNIIPYPGEKVLTQPTLDHDVLSKSEDDLPLSSALSLSEVGESELEESEVEETGTPSLSLSMAPTDEDGYGAALTHQRQHGTRWLRFKRGLPLLLGTTSIVAAISGGVLGYVFRIQDVEQLEQSPLFGSEIFGRDQEFPPSEHWPGLSPTIESSPSVLFERSRPQNASRSIPKSGTDVVFSDSGTGVENPSASGFSRSGSTVVLDEADAVNSGAIRQGTGEITSNDNVERDGNAELTPESSPEIEPSSPDKTPKPQAVQQQPVVPAPSPDISSESTINPPPSQPQPSRIDEMPPASGAVSPPPQPTRVPVPNVAAPARTPTKQPKLLITPVPSPQNQSVEVDSTDFSHIIQSDSPS